MKKWLFSVSLSILLAACGGADVPDDEQTPEEIVAGDSVVGVAAEAGFSAFVEALQEASLDDDFASGGPYTLFVPTNAAFGAADSEAEDLLEYHVIAGSYTLDELESGAYETASDVSLQVSVQGGSVSLNGGEASVTTPNDLAASNGYVHAIDSLLTPPEPDDEDEEPEPTDTFFTATLGPASENVEGTGAGEATATLDGTTLNVEGNVQNLSGPVTQVALYEGGGDDTGVLLYELQANGTSFSGSPNLTQEEVEVLEAGDFYVTVSTETYPEGEVSGQLLPED